MIRPGPQPLPEPVATNLVVDHIGVVVHDLAAEVAAWRSAGFIVSDPVPLMAAGMGGEAVPLGQSSAHVVFRNGYVELSSPDPGSGNHLEPYLELGEGVRILVLATGEAEAARRVLLPRWPGLSDVRQASRTVRTGAREGLAIFHWFPLPQSLVPGVLSAVVEHRTRDLVLDPGLAAHPNGLSRIASIVAEGRPDDCLALPGLDGAPSDAPLLAVAAQARQLAVTGLSLTGEGRAKTFFRLG